MNLEHGFMTFSIFVINILRIAKTQLRIVMQDKIFKVKRLLINLKSVEVFSYEIFRLYIETLVNYQSPPNFNSLIYLCYVAIRNYRYTNSQ